VDHRLTQVLGTRAPALVPRNDLAAGSVVVDDMRMIHREIIETAIGIVDGISAAAHHLANQAIGFEGGGPWLIDEPRLHASPRGTEALRVLTREWPDRKRLHSHLALAQLPFSLRWRST
jgi:hypothetical protein